MSSTKKPKSFICSYCEKAFSFHNQLVVHIRQHTGEKPFQCEICQKSFASLKVLKVHERVHTGERPYKCPYCEKSFSAYANLVVHRRIHTHEKPYQCKLCKRAFEHSGNLSRHFRAHMTDFGFRCILCSRIFEKDFELLEHTKIDHSNEYMNYTLSTNNNNNQAINKNVKRGEIVPSSSSIPENLSMHKYSLSSTGKPEKLTDNSAMQVDTEFSSSCSLNEISSTTECLPKKWRARNSFKQYLKSSADLYPVYSNGEKVSENPKYTENSNDEPMAVDALKAHLPVTHSRTEPIYDHFMAGNMNEEIPLHKHFKYKKYASPNKEYDEKFYNENPSYNEDIVYDLRKQTYNSNNPPPLIPIERVSFNHDNRYPVDLSFPFANREKETKDITGSYENLYPTPKLETEPVEQKEIATPTLSPYEGSMIEMFDAPHFLKGMLQRTNVFNFYVSELKKFTFRKKVEKVLGALLGKAKLKEFGYPEKSCEQVLIRILDTINQTPCADVRVDEEDRFRINVRLLLEKSFPDEQSQQKLGWIGKSVDFILDQIISQEQKERGYNADDTAWLPQGNLF